MLANKKGIAYQMRLEPRRSCTSLSDLIQIRRIVLLFAVFGENAVFVIIILPWYVSIGRFVAKKNAYLALIKAEKR